MQVLNKQEIIIGYVMVLIMTKFDFYALCGKYLIDVDIALESEELRKLLRNKANTETIENFLKEQF